ncbi:MAG: OmpA family protein [Polyangiaceae bacterium]
MRARNRIAAAALAGFVCLAGARVAHAQNAIPDANGEGFDTHLFRPALDSKGFFHTNGSQILGANDISFGLILDYANTLLRVADKGQQDKQLLNHSFQGTLQFNYGLANWATIGLSAPLNLMFGEAQATQSGAPVFPGRWTQNQVDSQTLGNIALHGKLRLLRVERGLGIAVSAQAGVPLSKVSRDGGGDPGFWYWPQLIVDKHFGDTGWFKVGVNAGFRGHIVSTTQLDLAEGLFKDGNRLTYGLGMSVRVVPEALDLVADTYGTYLLSDSAANVKASNEVVGGIKLFIEKNSYLQMGAGTRYLPGFEAADVRGFIGFIFEPSIGDRDGDGIKDDVDKCPDAREDFDGFEDEDGCPDPDNDKDGIPDYKDACPNEPEDFDGDQDEDGCPEFTDGDRDGDGVPDSKDRCPDVPGKKELFGCPDTSQKDRDGDGIPDAIDKCPDQPENFNGYQDDDGCPDPDVAVGEGGLVLFKKIQFKTNSAEILPESNTLLDQIAQTLKEHPEILLMEIAGHADERAGAQYNLQLTQRRVDSVMAALTARNVEKSRLRSKGYGLYCPEDEGHNEEAWAKNRRVEFKIVKNKEGGIPPKLGCDKASANGVKPAPIPP